MKYNSETGRSMVEMIGVLAIIGVLTIGGMIGMQYAMDKNAANQTLEDLRQRAVACSQQLQVSNSCDLSDFPDKVREGYAIRLSLDSNGNRFFLNLVDVPEGVCKKLIQSKWKAALIWKTDGGAYATMAPANCSELSQMTFAFDRNLSEFIDLNGELCAPGSSTTCPTGTGMDCQGAAVAGYCGCKKCFSCEGYSGEGYRSFCPAGQVCSAGGCICQGGGCPTGESMFCPDGSSWVPTGHKDNCNNPCYTCETNSGTDCVPSCPEGTGTECSGSEVSGGTCGAVGCKTCFSCEGYMGGQYYTSCAGGSSCTSNGCVCDKEGCPEGTSKTCPEGKLKLYAGQDGCGLACYTCADDRCNGQCKNGAVCLDNGKCYCQNGWSGENCDVCDGKPSGGACCLIGQSWNVALGKCVTDGCPNGGIMQEDGTCDNNYCQDNSQCKKGMYCSYNPKGTKDEDRGYGSCSEIKIDNKNSGNGWVASKHQMDWWSATSFCEAIGKRLPKVFEFCDGGHSYKECQVSNTLNHIFKEQFTYMKAVWTSEVPAGYPNNIYCIGDSGFIGNQSRQINYNSSLQPYALCR